jgi:hypothetical protein
MKGKPTWNAGTSEGHTDKRGYRWIYVTKNGIRTQRREHRVVMERHLGRDLEPWELVHHRNGDRSDNRVENLEVQDWSAHTTDHKIGHNTSTETKEKLEVAAQCRQEIARLRKSQAKLLAQRNRLLEASKELLRDFEGVCDFWDGPCDPNGSHGYAEIQAVIAEIEKDE